MLENVLDRHRKLIYGLDYQELRVLLPIPTVVFSNLISQTDSYRVRKAWKRGICNELVKPLIGIQRVEVPPDESLAGTSVASVAIHRVTGG